MHSPSQSQRFPMWLYLNQPLFHPDVKLLLNPGQFWRQHQIEFLNRCWHRDCAQYRHPNQ